MDCKHEHLRTVGHRLFCKDCKAELPIEFLTGGEPEEPETPVVEEPEEETAPEAPAVVTETAEVPPEPKKTGKSPAKKRTPKKAE